MNIYIRLQEKGAVGTCATNLIQSRACFIEQMNISSYLGTFTN